MTDMEVIPENQKTVILLNFVKFNNIIILIIIVNKYDPIINQIRRRVNRKYFIDLFSSCSNNIRFRKKFLIIRDIADLIKPTTLILSLVIFCTDRGTFKYMSISFSLPPPMPAKNLHA